MRRELMEESDALGFERGARLRDRAGAVESVAQRQSVLARSGREQEVIGLARGAGTALVAVLTVRGGRVLGSETFELEGSAEREAGEIRRGFAGQFYGDATSYPRDVLVPRMIADAETLAEWMSGRRGARVSISVPQRGERARLLEMAANNAEEALTQATIKKDYDSERSEKLLADQIGRAHA